MHIYLKHLVYGTKVAISEMEARADEENGWVRYNVSTPVVNSDAAPVNLLEVKRRRRRTVGESDDGFDSDNC